MFWICAESSVDNRDVLVTAEQCLQSQGLFFFLSQPTSEQAEDAQ